MRLRERVKNFEDKKDETELSVVYSPRDGYGPAVYDFSAYTKDQHMVSVFVSPANAQRLARWILRIEEK